MSASSPTNNDRSLARTLWNKAISQDGYGYALLAGSLACNQAVTLMRQTYENNKNNYYPGESCEKSFFCSTVDSHPYWSIGLSVVLAGGITTFIYKKVIFDEVKKDFDQIWSKKSEILNALAKSASVYFIFNNPQLATCFGVASLGAIVGKVIQAQRDDSQAQITAMTDNVVVEANQRALTAQTDLKRANAELKHFKDMFDSLAEQNRVLGVKVSMYEGVAPAGGSPPQISLIKAETNAPMRPQFCDTVWHEGMPEAIDPNKFTNYIREKIIKNPEYQKQIKQLDGITDEIAQNTIPFLNKNTKSGRVTLAFPLKNRVHTLKLTGNEELKKAVKEFFSNLEEIDKSLQAKEDPEETFRRKKDTFIRIKKKQLF